MKLSMEYFDSEALTKEQEIVHLKAPPPYFPAKIAFKCPAWIWYITGGCFVWSTNVVEYDEVTW